ncbi:MAG: orotidine-5'-phosphate decarboxylase [Bacteroidota bacterium]
MNRQELVDLIFEKKSFLCVGLDTDINKIPEFLKSEADPIFSFNKAIIDATIDLAIAYKPNMAFYECLGSKGWKSLEKTMKYINSKESKVFTIADAKRGDIGNTAAMYANAFFDVLNFDAITINPYMGADAVSPFLNKDGKWVILLALTSNKSADDFQKLQINKSSGGKQLFEVVIEKALQWGNDDNLMFVVGATQSEMLKSIRNILPNSFLLIPGVGAQGGNLEEVVKYGMTKDCGLLVNASRSIIYAGNGSDYAEKAKEAASKIQSEMKTFLTAHSY